MKKKFIYILPFLLSILTIISCEKEIDVELTEGAITLVVDGSITPDMPPIIQLSKTQGYYDPVNLEAISDLSVTDAEIELTVDGSQITLDLICLSQLPPEFQDQVSELLGVPVEDLQGIDLCVYTTLDPNYFGVVGKNYQLDITWEGKVYSGTTRMTDPVKLDSLWFEPWENSDSLGVIYAQLSDPGGVRNNYRVLTQRINNDSTDSQKDPFFIASLNSAFDDKFFDGLTFDFFIFRGRNQFANKPEDEFGSPEQGLFKRGDTVVVEFNTIDENVYQFYIDFSDQISSSGSPFASPVEVVGNITDATGIFGGFTPTYDTLVIEK